jgi:hypothetical protein
MLSSLRVLVAKPATAVELHGEGMAEVAAYTAP